MTPSNQARLPLAALAATLLASLCVAPLVQGLAWFVAVAVVACLITGAGAATRQVTRWVPLVIAVQFLTLVLAVTGLFARDAAVAGLIPGPEALAQLVDLKDEGLDVVRHDGPPVPSGRGIVLLVTLGLGAVALVVDVVAVSLRRPAVAGLPLLLVYCVPAAVLPGGLGWIWFVIGGLGYLGLVGADAGDRIRGWGRVLGSPDADGRALGGPLSGARRIGVTALAVAVALPAFVPGLGERLLTSGSGTGTGTGPGDRTVNVVNPILQLRDNLGQRSDAVVITYRTSAASPEPLRIVTVDEFKGDAWQPRATSLPDTQRVGDVMPSPPGLSAGVDARAETTEIEVGELAQTYLPLPYPSTRVGKLQGTWLYDKETLNVVGGGDMTTRGVSYEAQHLTVSPTAAQLSRASAPASNIAQRYTELPTELRGPLAQIARTRAGDPGSSDHAKATRLQNWLRTEGGFQYSETVVPGDQSADDGGGQAVLDFLTTGKRGYCVQFASSMALLARSLDIPARVAVGFLPGRQLGDDSYQITLRDAHAWPELYFEGVGWVRFEPTPSARTGQAPAWAPPNTSPSAAPTPSAAGSVSAPTRSQAPEDENAAPAVGDEADEQALIARVVGAVPWQVPVLLLVVLLLLAAPRTAAALARRARWRRADGRTARAEAAWDELRDGLHDLGVAWAVSWTPRAVLQRLSGEYELDGESRSALSRLVSEVESARYATPGGEGPQPARARADVAQVCAAVAARVPTAARRRALWMPASGLAAVTGVARRVDVAADRAGRRAANLRPRLHGGR